MHETFNFFMCCINIGKIPFILMAPIGINFQQNPKTRCLVFCLILKTLKNLFETCIVTCMFSCLKIFKTLFVFTILLCSMSSETSTQHLFQLTYSCTYLYFRTYVLCLTRVMYVLHDLEWLYLCLSIKLVQTGAHPELYKGKAVGPQ